MASTQYFVDNELYSDSVDRELLKYAQVGDLITLGFTPEATIMSKQVLLTKNGSECRLLTNSTPSLSPTIASSGKLQTFLDIDRQRFGSPFDHPYILAIKTGDIFLLDGTPRKVASRSMSLKMDSKILSISTTTP